MIENSSAKQSTATSSAHLTGAGRDATTVLPQSNGKPIDSRTVIVNKTGSFKFVRHTPTGLDHPPAGFEQVKMLAREVYRRAQYQLVPWDVRKEWEKPDSGISARTLNVDGLSSESLQRSSPNDVLEAYIAHVQRKRGLSAALEFREALNEIRTESSPSKQQKSSIDTHELSISSSPQKDPAPASENRTPQPQPLPLPGAQVISAKPESDKREHPAPVPQQLPQPNAAFSFGSSASNGPPKPPTDQEAAQAKTIELQSAPSADAPTIADQHLESKIKQERLRSAAIQAAEKSLSTHAAPTTDISRLGPKATALRPAPIQTNHHPHGKMDRKPRLSSGEYLRRSNVGALRPAATEPKAGLSDQAHAALLKAYVPVPATDRPAGQHHAQLLASYEPKPASDAQLSVLTPQSERSEQPIDLPPHQMEMTVSNSGRRIVLVT